MHGLRIGAAAPALSSVCHQVAIMELWGAGRPLLRGLGLSFWEWVKLGALSLLISMMITGAMGALFWAFAK
jgi:hypothetical protein